MSNQQKRQVSVRGVTGTAYDYNGDWIALFNARSIPAGAFDERMLGYINGQLLSNYTNLNDAMRAFAVDQGSPSWNELGTFTP